MLNRCQFRFTPVRFINQVPKNPTLSPVKNHSISNPSLCESVISAHFYDELKSLDLLGNVHPFDPAIHQLVGAHGTSWGNAKYILRDGFKVKDNDPNSLLRYFRLPGIYVSDAESASFWAKSHSRQTCSEHTVSDDTPVILYLVSDSKTSLEMKMNDGFETYYYDKCHAPSIRVAAIRSESDIDALVRTGLTADLKPATILDLKLAPPSLTLRVERWLADRLK